MSPPLPTIAQRRPDLVALRLGYCTSSIRKLAARSLARLQRWAADDPNERGDPAAR